LKKNYFSSHKLPKQQSTTFWSQGILGVNIKEDEDTYAFNRILVQYGAKLKWETKRMEWC
jgi:hypothetical protein